MSGQFTHLYTDREAYFEKVNRSTDPLLYRLDPNFAVNKQKCFAPYGPRAGQQASDVIGQQIEVDSVLRGISKISTKSNRQQMPDPLKYNAYQLNDCSDYIETEYSRYITPAYDIKGLTTSDLNFDYPLYDPQCNIFENFALNTKLEAKDNFRASWQIPINQRDLFPSTHLGNNREPDIDTSKYGRF